MIKNREEVDPKSCFNKARPDEMLFVLLSRDAAAPATILFWIQERLRLGKNKLTDQQITEAFYCVQRMESQRIKWTEGTATLFPPPTPPMSMEEAHRITKEKLGNPEGIVCCWTDKVGFRCAVGLGGTGRDHKVLGGGNTWEQAVEDLERWLNGTSGPCRICGHTDCETPNQKH